MSEYSWAIVADNIGCLLMVSGLRECSREWINPADIPLVGRNVLLGMFSMADNPLDYLRMTDQRNHLTMHSFRVGGWLRKSLAGTAVDEITKDTGWKTESVAKCNIGATSSGQVRGSKKKRGQSSLAWFSRWLADQAGQTNGLAPAMVCSGAPPPGYHVLRSVGVGAAIAPVASR